MDVSTNHGKLKTYLAAKNIDAVWVPSSDRYLSEYNAITNNLRYGLSNFSGSTGDGLFLTNPPAGTPAFQLMVDGRYHVQADQECNQSIVNILKLDLKTSPLSILEEIIQKNGIKKLGVPAARVSLSFWNKVSEIGVRASCELVVVDDEELLKLTGLEGWNVSMDIQVLPKETLGLSFDERVQTIRDSLKKHAGTEKYLGVMIASDDISYTLSARGYSMPFLSSVLGQLFMTNDEIMLYLSPGVNIKQIPPEWSKTVRVIASLATLFKEVGSRKVEKILYHSGTMNAYWPVEFKRILPNAVQVSDWRELIDIRAQKTAAELDAIRASFIRSSKAIARTLRFGIENAPQGNYSEADQAAKIATEFKAEGAVGQSFNTISGFGPNSAIVHYGANRAENKAKVGEITLLDCGAYFESGFATDTTRGFFVRGRAPEAWQKDIYTTTLRAGIIPFLKPVPATLSGQQVDALIRGKIIEKGYDYMHGTGHGIGIHVHEDGIRLSTASTYPQVDQAVVSVEPGIYLEGKGGVRIENVAILHKEKDTFRYENIVFVGYDWDLVDVAALSPEEKTYLKSYEQKCKELGTTITECPL